jgi:energy-coupling factor transport system permease protein
VRADRVDAGIADQRPDNKGFGSNTPGPHSSGSAAWTRAAHDADSAARSGDAVRVVPADGLAPSSDTVIKRPGEHDRARSSQLARGLPDRVARRQCVDRSPCWCCGLALSHDAMTIPMTGHWRLPRPLHPAAWWLWALCLGVAATRTTNPLLLLLIGAVAGFVVAARRPNAPWSRSYGAFLKLGLVVLTLRIVIEVLFGSGGPGHVVLRLPVAPLPHWMAGVRVGGPVTADQLARACYDGLQLAVLLCCVGAANALASPARMLKLLPGALYEAGVAVTVALSFAPQAVASISRVRAARRLRGRPSHGLRAWRGLAVPILEEALERSVDLAAAMDARGFGRRAGVSRTARATTAGLTLGGVITLTAASYFLIGQGASRAVALPLLLAGVAAATAGLLIGGRRTRRTRYRPDPWRVPEWLVAVAGLATVVVVSANAHLDPAALAPTTTPLVVPPLPLLATLGILLALLPAWAAPTPTGARTRAVPAQVLS